MKRSFLPRIFHKAAENLVGAALAAIQPLRSLSFFATKAAPARGAWKIYEVSGLKIALAAALLIFHLPSSAEDVDLFVGATPPSTTEAPNVLIVLDNTANWNTPFINEKAALVSVLNGLAVDKFRVGLMMFTETGSGDTGNDGAYVRAAIRLMDGANKPLYQNLVNALDVGNDKSNGGKIGKAMEEAYLYFSHGTPHAGSNKNKTDYAGNAYNPNPAAYGASLAASRAVWALPNNALTSKAGTPYANPVVSGCAKNYIIYISNGAAQDNAADTTQATAALSAVGGNTTAIPLSPSGSMGNMADEWARFMKTSSLGITTYTVDIDKVTTGQGPGWTKLLQSTAGVSGGKYFDVSSSAAANISDALNRIFSEIQSVNSVFASVSLPVSVNTQGTYLNQVFVGMFRPDADAYPRWAGNLKQYKLGLTGSTLNLQDADGVAAINGGTGFITECARSFWTPTATDSYWAFKPQGACLAVADSNVSNYPDGNVVEKGAQGYKLRAMTPASRTAYTCSPSSCSSLTSFGTGNGAITTALLGAASTDDRNALINWEIGQDIYDEKNDGATTLLRPSAHGDVVHSRPTAINIGSDVVVFYGGNDGVLRAVNGNRSNSIGSVAAGGEMWSFVAPEFYGNIKRIRDNTTPISFPGSAGGQQKPYGVDGPVTAYQGATNAWIYATLRRGGQALYAFDVSAPASPSLKWKGCDGCSPNLEDIGQTWSSPKAFKAPGYAAGASPMIIMGGGYDTCEDADPNTCTSSNKGSQVFVLDANTGSLLKTLSTDRGVAGDITVVPDSAGLAKSAYLADLGGNVYRIDIGSNAPASWAITKIASLGCGSAGACYGVANRKFMFAPDVVEDGGIYYILIGSGDREKPLTSYASAYGVTNYFFMVKDDLSNTGLPYTLGSLTQITTTTPSSDVLAASKGWYLALAPHEQVVTSAVTLYGVTTFSTHTPAVPVAGSCESNLGTANVYNISYLDAATKNETGARFQQVAGGGLSPSPVAGVVTLDSGQTVPFVIGASPTSPLEGVLRNPPSSSSGNLYKGRVYWYIQQ